MKDSILIKTIVENYITENKFTINKTHIRNILNETLSVDIKKIKTETYNNISVLTIFYGKNKSLCFTINGEDIIFEELS